MSVIQIEQWQWDRLMEVLWAIHQRLEDSTPQAVKDERASRDAIINEEIKEKQQANGQFGVGA